MDSEVLFIYRLMPRRPDFLGWLSFFDPLQLVAFWGLLGELTVPYIIKVLVSGCPSINPHCILLLVKFDGGLSISILRNKQLFFFF
jgi:hypothetical protein